jgi:hypothetical protein
MPTKKVIEMPKPEEVTTVAFDETHQFGENFLRFKIDLAHIQSDITEYINRLRKHRKIKDESALEFLTYDDDFVKLAYTNLSEIDDENERMVMAIDEAKDHYAELLETVRNEAFMLALTIDNDLSHIEVAQYEDESERRVLPGIGELLPKPKRDIRFATEKRLAQVFQVLSADLQKWQGLRNRIIIQFSMLMKKYGESRLDGSTF